MFIWSRETHCSTQMLCSRCCVRLQREWERVIHVNRFSVLWVLFCVLRNPITNRVYTHNFMKTVLCTGRSPFFFGVSLSLSLFVIVGSRCVCFSWFYTSCKSMCNCPEAFFFVVVQIVSLPRFSSVRFRCASSFIIYFLSDSAHKIYRSQQPINDNNSIRFCCYFECSQQIYIYHISSSK